MQGSVALLLPRLVVLIILAGSAPPLVGAQTQGGLEAGEGVSYQLAFNSKDFGGEASGGYESEIYEFVFAPEAFLPEPEQLDPESDGSPGISKEAMTVFVDVGPFVLYAPPTVEVGGAIVYSPDGNPVTVEQWSDSLTMVSSELCPSPCTVPADRYALVQPGGYVVHQEDTGCTY